MSLSSLSRDEYVKKKRKKNLTRLGIVFGFIILLIGLASYVAHRSTLRISKVELHGQVLVEQSELEAAAEGYMSGSYFWLFPKNNFLWYPRKKLERHLADTFKRIDTIYIEKRGLDTITVDITERKAVAIWSDTLPGIVTDREGGNTEVTRPKYYFMDSNSAIFAEAPSFSGNAYFKYYGLIATSTPIGQYYIASGTDFAEIAEFVESTRKLNLDPQYIIASEGGEFSLIISGGGKIYFDTKESLSKVSSNLEALLRAPALSQNISHLDYIDLRFGNKLYYKLK